MKIGLGISRPFCYVCSTTFKQWSMNMGYLNQYDELMQKIGKNLIEFIFPVEMNRIMHISPNIDMMAALLSSRFPFTDSFTDSNFYGMILYTYLSDFNKTIRKWDKEECERVRKVHHDRFQAYIQFQDNEDGCAKSLIDLHSYEQEVNDMLKKNHNEC